MGGYVWRIALALAGALTIAGNLGYQAREPWVQPPQAGQLASVAGGLLVFVGLIGVVRRIVNRRRGAENGKLGTLALFLLACLFAAPTGLGCAHLGHMLNLQTAERARWREAQQAKEDDAYPWKRYLEWAERLDPQVAPRRHDFASLERLRQELDSMSRADPRWSDLSGRSNTLWKAQMRWSASKRSQHTTLLRSHTPFTQHVEAAFAGYDDALWAHASGKSEAARLYKAKPLRAYLAELPEGRHADDARAALRALYDQAANTYAETYAPKADPQAREGIKALLAWLRDSDADQLTVPVCFLPVEGLHAERLEQVMAKLTGAKAVVPVSPAFTAAQNRKRQGIVVDRMEKALGRVIYDLFDLAERPLDGTRQGPRFLVRYEVAGTGIPYSRADQKDLPISQQTVYIGIELRFTFTLQVPKAGPKAEPLSDDPAQGYRFRVKARPAAQFSFRQGQSPEQEAQNVYGSMAWTAFNQFVTRLAAGYGFGRPKKGN